MALQDVWTYDHAPQSASADISQGTSLTSYSPAGTTYNLYTDLPGMLYKNTGGSGFINPDGFLYLVSSSSWNPALLVKASDVQDWTNATKYWIGFRTKAVTARSTDSSQLFNISSSLNQASWTPILTEGDMTSNGFGTLNTEYYVEVMIDRQNLLFEVWINGAKIKSGALTGASVITGGGSYYFWGSMNSASATANAARCFKDFYFLMWTLQRQVSWVRFALYHRHSSQLRLRITHRTPAPSLVMQRFRVHNQNSVAFR